MKTSGREGDPQQSPLLKLDDGDGIPLLQRVKTHGFAQIDDVAACYAFHRAGSTSGGAEHTEQGQAWA